MTTDLNFKKYKRFFAFGCSFTHYKWPTWADVIAQEIGEENSFNFGISGAGNFFIAHSISEADARYKFTADDLIMVMWTNHHREDRFIKHRGWLTPGNIYSQNLFDQGFMKYFDDDHALMRDLMLVKFVKNFLENKGIDHHMMTMVPFGHTLDGPGMLTKDQQQIMSFYKDEIDAIKTSIWEVCFDCDWHSRQPRSVTFTNNPGTNHHVYGKGWYEDNHAHPKEHLEYLQKLWPDTQFKDSTVEYVNYWHQRVLDKKDMYTGNLIERTPVVRIQ